MALFQPDEAKPSLMSCVSAQWQVVVDVKAGREIDLHSFLQESLLPTLEQRSNSLLAVLCIQWP